MATEYDVIIIGGGNVGLTAACALGEQGLRVAVIEARVPVPCQAGDEVDLRVFALTRASEQLFTSIGVWDRMVELGVGPFREMEVWDADGYGYIHFDSAEMGEDCLGHIVEHRVMQSALLARLARHPGVQMICPGRLAAINVQPGYVHLDLEDGSSLQAKLVIGADGVASRVRDLEGITARKQDYQQSAIVAVVATEQPHRETAWQRFMPTGPLAFLPLKDGRCSIVWTMKHEEAALTLEMDDESFNAKLGKAFDHRLGMILSSGPRAEFPLGGMHAEQYVKPRIALAGDAAHAIHPLAGQGVNLGLLDAAALAEVVLKAVEDGRDPGSLKILRRYERWRRGDNLLMKTAMEGFNGLFGNSIGPIRLIRNTGLLAVNALVPVKGLIMKHAMGLGGDLPVLARRPGGRIAES